MVYDDAVHDAAQARVDLALEFVRGEGIEAIGEVGDPDPYTATIDAVREHRPAEILISTYPETRSGWLRRDLIDRVREATGLPVEHIVNDIDSEGLPFHVTLAVANRTASGDELLEALKPKAQTDPEDGRAAPVHRRRAAGGRARSRHGARADAPEAGPRPAARRRGLYAAGMIGDPDPFTAIMNALQYFRVDDIVISTFPETKSGWLRTDLIERVRRATGKPVEHVVQRDAAGHDRLEPDGSRRDPPRAPRARRPRTGPRGSRRRRSGCCFSSSPR